MQEIVQGKLETIGVSALVPNYHAMTTCQVASTDGTSLELVVAGQPVRAIATSSDRRNGFNFALLEARGKDLAEP